MLLHKCYEKKHYCGDIQSIRVLLLFPMKFKFFHISLRNKFNEKYVYLYKNVSADTIHWILEEVYK